jgi:hypothetical protein
LLAQLARRLLLQIRSPMFRLIIGHMMLLLSSLLMV